jgi:hypothetical protein
VSAPQAHSRVSNINIDIWIFFCAGGLYKYPMKNILRTAKFLLTWVSVKGIVWAFTWLRCLGGCLHLKPTVGCQISTLIFDFFCGGGSLWISYEKYIKDGKVLAHLGLQSKILAGLLTDWSAWADFCTSSLQQGVKYQLGYYIFLEGDLY